MEKLPEIAYSIGRSILPSLHYFFCLFQRHSVLSPEGGVFVNKQNILRRRILWDLGGI
jgi:hypothetical protein